MCHLVASSDIFYPPITLLERLMRRQMLDALMFQNIFCHANAVGPLHTYCIYSWSYVIARCMSAKPSIDRDIFLFLFSVFAANLVVNPPSLLLNLWHIFNQRWLLGIVTLQWRWIWIDRFSSGICLKFSRQIGWKYLHEMLEGLQSKHCLPQRNCCVFHEGRMERSENTAG